MKTIRLFFKTFIILILVLPLTGASSPANTDKTQDILKGKVLSLDEFITRACSHDNNFQVILIDELALQYKKDLSLPSKDLVISLTGQYDFLLSGTGNSGPESAISLAKLFPTTGTEVSTSYSITPSNTSSSSSHSVGTLISQPIARNAFGKANRLQERIIGLENNIAQYQIVGAYEDYLASLAALYYQWYADYGRYETAAIAHRDNLILLANVQKRRRSKIALAVDENKVRLQVLSSQGDMLQYRTNYLVSRQLIYQSIDHRESSELIPKLGGYEEVPPLSTETSIASAIDAKRTGKILELLEKKGKLSVQYYGDALLPSVNLLFGYSWNKSAAYGKSYNRHMAYGGLKLDYPLGTQTQEAQLGTAKVDLTKTRLTSADNKQKLINSLVNIQRQMVLEEKLIKEADRRIALSRAIVKAEARRYGQARISLDDLISARQTSVENRFYKISHEVALKTLQVEWLRLTDSLVRPKDLKRPKLSP